MNRYMKLSLIFLGTFSPFPVIVQTLTAASSINYKAITAGSGHTCALTASGVAYCWGANQLGQLGNGTTANAAAPTLVAGILKFASISANGESTCAITHQGVAYCWGDNLYGQAGTPASTATCGTGSPCSKTPIAVASTVKFASISVGRVAACALSMSGDAYCWGDNGNGELGIGSFTGPDQCAGRPCSRNPIPVAGGLRFKTINAGASNACGVSHSNDALYCWGDGQLDQLGNGIAQSSGANSPMAVAGALEFSAMRIGAVVSCGITKQGSAYCWGNGIEDGLGTTTPPEICNTQGFGNFPCASAPNPVMGAIWFVSSDDAIGLVRTTTCAISKAGPTYCWGRGDEGQLGNGTAQFSTPIPTVVSGGLNFKAIASGGGHACGLTQAGDAYCWGGNGFGQGGFTPDASYVPMKVNDPI